MLFTVWRRGTRTLFLYILLIFLFNSFIRYENALKDYYKKQISQLNALIVLLLGSLSKGDRQKVRARWKYFYQKTTSLVLA